MYTQFHAHPYNPNLCTLDTCPIEYAMLSYRPTVPGNAVYLGIFAVILIIHAIQAIHYKTWTFFIGVFCGLVLEILGYAGRLMLYNNPFPLSTFLLYFIPTSLGPAFLTASIYICLGRIIVATKLDASRIQPRTYTLTFISADFFSLVLQAIGGALTATATTDSGRTTGTDILIAGLVFQVFSMIVYMCLWAEYTLRVRKLPEDQKNLKFASMRNSWRFKGFQIAFMLATALIFIRCIYRVVELQEGFSGALANNQVIFMVLEGPMIIAATALMAIFHPGFAFQGRWNACQWSFRVPKTGPVQEKRVTADSSSEEVVV